MLDLKIYEDIASFTSEGLLVAKPRYTEKNEIYDFEPVYINQAYEKLTQNKIQKDQALSESMLILSKSIDWIALGQKAFETDLYYEQSFFSQNLNSWFFVSIKHLPSKLLLINLHDISKDKELEQQLRRQNLRLAALSEELVLSKQDLHNKLEKIQSLNSSLEHLAFHDPLTDLPNRSYFNEIINNILLNAQNINTKVALMFIDIDDLKDINDSQGHNFGDTILKLAGNQLKHFEKDDIQVFRFGGDEFLVLMTNVQSHNSVVTITDTILEALNIINIPVSAGISIYPDDAKSTDELLKFADMAMYQVKASGKNSSIFFEQLMHKQLLERLTLEEKIGEAIKNNCFQLYFQPQYDICSKSLRGFEALLRWHDKDLGWIQPDLFIPVAEDTKLIIPIGLWVIEKTFQTLEKWQKKHDFKGIISINVSPVQLKDPSFVFEVEALLNKYAITPKLIEIEITEGVLIDNTEQTVKTLNAIKKLGIGISLDDFGTGYSSLSYLKELPLTTLKIDKAFIANITTPNSLEAEITDSIISLVSKMGLDTIAEGVESEEQFEALKKINCRTSQGYLMGRPMPENECENLL
ncbi:MAG TPA: EAL domain-containing protein [Treponemataceae bacterium]|nr:EAL domain-containing protein [Treponemataceae bacterium]